MMSNLPQRVARLARFFRHSPSPRPAGRPRFLPALEGLEDRALPSTLSVVNLPDSGHSSPRGEFARAHGFNSIGVTTSATVGGVSAPENLVINRAGSGHAAAAGSGGLKSATPAGPTVSGEVVVSATDVPQPVDFPDVFTTSFINVDQSLAIASLKVQLNITYPLDNDLTIDLIAPDGTDVPLSYFEGTGADFRNTTFDDAAATPIWAGNSPFAGSYQPEGQLASVAGMNAQGTWELQIIDWGASSGTLNSWSLIIQPAGSFNSSGLVAALNASPLPSATLAAGTPLNAGQTDALAEPAVVPQHAGLDASPDAHGRHDRRVEPAGANDPVRTAGFVGHLQSHHGPWYDADVLDAAK
jgi:subtilisin-like proprotein convertase family protein